MFTVPQTQAVFAHMLTISDAERGMNITQMRHWNVCESFAQCDELFSDVRRVEMAHPLSDSWFWFLHGRCETNHRDVKFSAEWSILNDAATHSQAKLTLDSCFPWLHEWCCSLLVFLHRKQTAFSWSKAHGPSHLAVWCVWVGLESKPLPWSTLGLTIKFRTPLIGLEGRYGRKPLSLIDIMWLKMSACIFLCVSVRARCAWMTLIYTDGHEATTTWTRGSSARQVVSDGAVDAGLRTVRDLLSTHVLYGASVCACDGIGVAARCSVGLCRPIGGYPLGFGLFQWNECSLCWKQIPFSLCSPTEIWVCLCTVLFLCMSTVAA